MKLTLLKELFAGFLRTRHFGHHFRRLALFESLADTPVKKLAHEGEMMKTVDSQLGAVARPSRVHFVSVLPKTRSGKLLRRSIQALCEGRDPGDLTTIEDPSALEQIRGAVRV